MKVSIAFGPLSRLGGHGLGQHKSAAHRKGLVDGFQQRQHHSVGVVMGDAHQGDHIRAAGQVVLGEIARHGLYALGQSPARDLLLTDLTNVWQIEDPHLKLWVSKGQFTGETTHAAAHVQRRAVPVKRIGRQNFLDDKGLRRRHQLGVAGVGLGASVVGGLLGVAGIGPVVAHRTLPRSLQDGHRVVHVLVEQLVVLDHGLDARVADHRCPQGSQAITLLAALLEQAQRHSRLHQALQASSRHPCESGQFLQGFGGLLDVREQVQPNTAQQHLGMDKARHQVEHLACSVLGEPTGERV